MVIIKATSKNASPAKKLAETAFWGSLISECNFFILLPLNNFTLLYNKFLPLIISLYYTVKYDEKD